MKNLVFLVCIFCILIVLALPIHAQALFRNFYLYNVDTSRYPTLTASIYAQDSLGQSTLRLNVNEISLSENGIPRTGLTMVCDSLPTPIPIAACLTLDQSWSMSDKSPTGETYWQWVKDGAKAFINRLQFVPPTQVAITSFGGTSFVRSQFQQTRPPLLAAIDQIPNEGSTDYDEAFLNLSVQGGTNGNIYLLKNAPPSLRRICIFLTDGQPDNPPLKQRIIDSCLRHNITVYAINLFNPRSTTIHPDLIEICSTTGGRSYLVRTKAELVKVFEDIAALTQVNVACRLSWQSFSGCGEASRNRTLSCTVRRGTRSNTWLGRYIAPELSVASPTVVPPTLLFNDPGQGGTVQQTFSIRASQRTPMTITGYTFQPNNGRFRVVSSTKTLPATLLPNESMDVTVEFNQDALGKIYRSMLKTVSTPCIDSVSLIVNIPTIKLESPIGGERIDGCDSISIRWSGIPADEPVMLSYSTNKGTDWIPITNSATGLEYKWYKRIPGNDYMMRVQRLSCIWVNRIGGSGLDSGTVLTWNRKTRHLVIGGSFSDTIQTGVSTLLATQRDGVLLWLNSAGIPSRAHHIQGNGNESVDAIATDSSYHYLAAITTSSTQLQSGLKTLALLNSSSRSGIALRIDSTGNTLWMVGISSETPGSGDVIATSVFVRKDSMMYMQGYAQGNIKTYHLSDTIPSLKLDMPLKTGVYFPFTAEIDPRGRIVALIQRHTYPMEVRKTNTASNGNTVYEISTQSTPVRCNSNTIASKGGVDIVVRAVLRDPLVSQSNKTFSILVPRLKFSQNSFTMWAEDVGKSYVTPFGTASILGNEGNKDIPLVNASLIGRDQADFTLVKGNTPFPLSFVNTESFTINFSPRAVPYKPRECYLVTEAPCSDPDFVRVSAYANFRSLDITSVDMGLHRIGNIKRDSIMINNPDAGSIKINSIKVTGNESNAFTWSTVAKDGYIVGPNERVPVYINFSPTRKALDSITVTVEGEGIPVALVGTAKGRGWLPARTSNGFKFNPIVARTTSTEIGFATIASTDTTLTVYSSRWLRNSGVFSGAMITPNTLIPQGKDVTIPIQYSPTKAGLDTAYIVFAHDAERGPNPIPTAYDTVMITGEATDADVSTNSIGMPAILSCNTLSRSFFIRNLSFLQKLDVTSFELSGDTSMFTISPQPPFAIASKDSQEITVRYTPSAVGNHSARVIVKHSFGDSDTVTISASSLQAAFLAQFRENSITIPIGGQNVIQLNGSIRSTLPYVLDTIAVSVRTQPTFARMMTERFQTNQNNWIWRIADSSSSDNYRTYLFTGRYNSATQTADFPLLTLPFEAYLSSSLTDSIRAHVHAENVKSCLLVSSDSLSMEINKVAECAWNLRTVSFVNNLAATAFQTTNGTLRIEYSSSDKSAAEIEVYSSYGEVVYRAQSTTATAEQRVYDIPLSSVASGLHFCRVQVGNETVALPVLIVK